MPCQGSPITNPDSICWTYRWPSTQVATETAVDSIGGLEGSSQIRTFTSNVPTRNSSFFCPSPGSIALSMAFTIAAAPAGVFASCAAALAASPKANRKSSIKDAIQTFKDLFIVPPHLLLFPNNLLAHGSSD